MGAFASGGIIKIAQIPKIVGSRGEHFVLRRVVMPGVNQQQVIKDNYVIQVDAVNTLDFKERILASILSKEKALNLCEHLGEDFMSVVNPVKSVRGLNGPQDIPAAWRSALCGLRSLFPEAVLAGGALRDRDNGVKVKDLDVFIKAPEHCIVSLDRAAEAMRAADWDVNIEDSKIYADWFGPENRIVGIINTKARDCPPIQVIIGMFDMDRLLSYFDFGNSQIMYDGKVITKTNDYDHDHWMKQFKLVTQCDDSQFTRRVERFARLKSKYPEHKFHPGIMGENLGSLGGQSLKRMYGI